MLIKYVGPSPAVECPVALPGRVFVKNKPEEVPDDVAGRPAEPRLAAALAELVEASTPGSDTYDHYRANDLRQEIAGLDHGEGLLAQPDNWVAVAKKPAPVKEDDK